MFLTLFAVTAPAHSAARPRAAQAHAKCCSSSTPTLTTAVRALLESCVARVLLSAAAAECWCARHLLLGPVVLVFVSCSLRSSNRVIVVSCFFCSVQQAWKPIRIFVFLNGKSNAVLAYFLYTAERSAARARAARVHAPALECCSSSTQRHNNNSNSLNNNNRRTSAARVEDSCARNCLATSCSCSPRARRARVIE